MRSSPRTLRIALVLAAALLWPAPLRAIDWSSVADLDTVTVITTKEDGSGRETTIWIAVHDGQAYVRTAKTRWAEDIERDPNIVIRAAEQSFDVKADWIEDAELFETLQKVFREKYGFSDRMVTPIRALMGGPRIMRLDPR